MKRRLLGFLILTFAMAACAVAPSRRGPAHAPEPLSRGGTAYEPIARTSTPPDSSAAAPSSGESPPSLAPPGSLAAAKASDLQSRISAVHALPIRSKPPKDPLPSPSVGVGAGEVAGIDNDASYGPFSASDFVVSNVYQGPVGDDWFIVYAGMTGSENPVGAGIAGVKIFHEPEPGTFGQLGTILDTSTSGALTISSVSREVMALTTPSGERVTFDLATQQFT